MLQIRILSVIVIAAIVLIACSGPDELLPASATPEPAASEPVIAEAPTSTASVSPTREPTPEPSPTATATTGTPARPTPSPTAIPATSTATETNAGATPTATDAGESVPTASPIGATTAVDSVFPDEVEQLLEGRSGQYLVVAIGPNGEPQFRLNEDVQVQAASLYKLLIMVEVLKQVEDGRLELDRPVRMHSGYFVEAGFDDPFDDSYIGDEVNVDELLLPMVAFSSNVAAYALLDLVGNTNINATAMELGLTASEVRWMPAHRSDHVNDAARYAQVTPEAQSAGDAFNVTSAADMALLFQLMIDGELVSPGASERMLEILTAQVVNNRLPALLPPGTEVAHKTGNIDNVVHDAGVIYTPGGPAVVVVLTLDAVEWEAIEFMQELALLVYERGSG